MSWVRNVKTAKAKNSQGAHEQREVIVAMYIFESSKSKGKKMVLHYFRYNGENLEEDLH